MYIIPLSVEFSHIPQDEREVDSSPDQSSITPTIKVASEVKHILHENSHTHTLSLSPWKEPQHVVGEGSHTLRYGETTPPMSPRRFQSATLDPRSSRPGPAHPGNYRDQIVSHVIDWIGDAVQNISSSTVRSRDKIARAYYLATATASSVLSPEVDESTIQLPTLLLVVGAVSLPLEV